MLGVVALPAFLLACSAAATPHSTAVPVPTRESELQKYLRDVKAFALTHSETIELLASEIQRLSVEGSDRGLTASSAELFTFNPEGKTTEQIIRAIAGANSVPPEGQELLKSHKVTLQGLLLRVKRDQLALLRILPPAGVPANFHEVAMAILDLETVRLVSLLNVYSSPRLFVMGPELKELPTKIDEAKARLTLVTESWITANTYLLP